ALAPTGNAVLPRARAAAIVRQGGRKRAALPAPVPAALARRLRPLPLASRDRWSAARHPVRPPGALAVLWRAFGGLGHARGTMPSPIRRTRMRQIQRRRPTAALVISIVALFVALGGSSYAAFRLPNSSVGTKQLKNAAVTTPKLKNGTVTAAKL